MVGTSPSLIQSSTSIQTIRASADWWRWHQPMMRNTNTNTNTNTSTSNTSTNTKIDTNMDTDRNIAQSMDF